MKNLFLTILMAVIMMGVLCSCNNGNGGNGKIKYGKMSGDWPYYSEARELLEDGNLVFTGKITGISFAVLDKKTALIPNGETEDYNRALCTLYEVEIITSYKGDASDVTYFRVLGGLRDYRTDEQLQIMKENNAYNWEFGIPVFSGDEEQKYDIGETYLFVMHKYEGGSAPTILNPWQSVYGLSEPSKSQDFPNVENISIKDIISEFGQEAWDSFCSQ